MKTTTNLLLVEHYARALFSVSEKRQLTGKVHRELTALVKDFRESDVLRECLLHPFIDEEEKLKSLADLVSDSEVFELLSDFLRQLMRHRRLRLFPKILLAFEALADQSKNLVRATVRSARALNEARRERLQGLLERIFGRKVICDWREDAELLGGIQLKVGDVLWDGTLRGRLAYLRNFLTQEA